VQFFISGGSKMIVTRFAPTASGELHIGSLYNALLNYIFAKQQKGQFKIRFDGQLNPQRQKWCSSILMSLEKCGIVADEVYYSGEHTGEHHAAFKQLMKDYEERFYLCACTPSSVAERNLFGFSPENEANLVVRPEKYPPPCRIQQIILRDAEGGIVYGDDVKVEVKLCALMSDPQHPIENIESSSTSFWDPYPRGTGKTHINPEIFIEFKEEITVAQIEIVWHDYPVLGGDIRLLHNNTWHNVYSFRKTPQYFVEMRPSVPYRPGTSDVINIAPVYTKAVAFRFSHFALPLMKSYHYDHHCRDLPQILDLGNLSTNVRLKYENIVEEWGQKPWSNERIPGPFEPKVDTCVWFNGQPDLVFTSPYDDNELGVTHAIRGIDIYPFFWIEAPIAALLRTRVRNQYFHGMVVTPDNVKYSKFIESPSIDVYLEHGLSAEALITVLCQRAGIYQGEEVLNLQELVQAVDITKLTQKDIVFEWED